MNFKKYGQFTFILSLISISLSAQTINKAQAKFQQSVQMKLNGFVDTLSSNSDELAIADTLALPDISEVPVFYDKSNVNYLYIKRLDSIQKEVPLDHNQYVQQYIDIYANRKSFISDMLSLGTYYFPIFEEALAETDIPKELKYLPVIESSMNPVATSRVGAKGLWQFMNATAKEYGLSINNYVDERRDPVLASKAAANYLKEAYDEFGDWLLAIASYNCGSGNVRRAISRSGGQTDFWSIRPYLPKETRNYVPAYIAATYMMQCYDKHQIEAAQKDEYLNTENIFVSNPINLDRLAQNLDIAVDKLFFLNPSYTKHIINASMEEPKEVVLPQFVCADRTKVFNALNSSSDLNAIRLVDEPTVGSFKRSRLDKNMFSVKVRRGQTLSGIAATYNVSVGQLKSWNRLRKNTVHLGQSLKVYSSNAQYAKNNSKSASKKYYSYKVRSGDTLSEIAEKKGTSVTKIKQINGLKSGASIRPGMVIKVNRL